jgi:hypothetical protein
MRSAPETVVHEVRPVRGEDVAGLYGSQLAGLPSQHTVGYGLVARLEESLSATNRIPLDIRPAAGAPRDESR